MNLDIRGHHLEITPALRTFVEQKLAPVSKHHEDLIEEIQVRLQDVTGPHKGGEDMACRITAWLRTKVTVNVEEVDRDMHLSIDRACDRIDRAITREKERARSIDPHNDPHA